MSAPGPSLQARPSRVALDCVFSINRTTGFSWAKVHKEKFSPYRLAAHVFRYLRQTFWQLTISWPIWFRRDDNELPRRSSRGFDGGGRLAAPPVENIEFQRERTLPSSILLPQGKFWVEIW